MYLNKILVVLILDTCLCFHILNICGRLKRGIKK